MLSRRLSDLYVPITIPNGVRNISTLALFKGIPHHSSASKGQPKIQTTKPSNSSSTTARATPPNTWVRQETQFLIGPADKLIKTYSELLSNSQCSDPEDSDRIRQDDTTEEDVKAATLKYVLDPVSKALGRLPIKDITIEVAMAPPSPSDLFPRERSKHCDVVFTARHKDGKETAVMCLELKNRGHVFHAEEQFKNAAVDKLEEAKLETRMQLADNALVLSKQATVYANDYETPFVAVFDYDAIFFWRFDNLPADRVKDRTAGTYGAGWFSKDGTEITRMLLGFAIEALKHKKLLKDEDLTAVTKVSGHEISPKDEGM
ncbi:hypothetical protein F4774DRAFT_407873 [Daldinia eschscholtzii]|nr:hypothetical protein F4774DRAFT_407873 [Daldinia eschscholtzii]